MKRTIISLAIILMLLCAFAPAASAQVEVGGAFSFLRTGGNPGPGDNLFGWDASLATHLISDFALEADYSDAYGSNYRPGFTELYGPRFELLSLPHLEPYVHALIGSVHENPGGGNSFAYDFGGGVEVKYTRHVWLRLFQLDYAHYRYGGGSAYSGRVSAGIVFRFGSW